MEFEYRSIATMPAKDNPNRRVHLWYNDLEPAWPAMEWQPVGVFIKGSYNRDAEYVVTRMQCSKGVYLYTVYSNYTGKRVYSTINFDKLATAYKELRKPAYVVPEGYTND